HDGPISYNYNSASFLSCREVIASPFGSVGHLASRCAVNSCWNKEKVLNLLSLMNSNIIAKRLALIGDCCSLSIASIISIEDCCRLNLSAEHCLHTGFQTTDPFWIEAFNRHYCEITSITYFRRTKLSGEFAKYLEVLTLNEHCAPSFCDLCQY